MGMTDEIEANREEYAAAPQRQTPDEDAIAEQNRRASAYDPFDATKAIAKAYDAMHGLSAPAVVIPLPNQAMSGVTVAKLMREAEECS